MINEIIFESFPRLSSNRFELIEIKGSHLKNIFEFFSDKRATQYFDLLPLENRIEAEVMQGNIGLEKLLTKLNFQKEGIFKQLQKKKTYDS